MPGVHIALLCSYTALFIAVYLAPFYLQDTLGTGPTVAGLTLLAYPAASATVGLAGGALTDRLGARAVAAVGAVLVTAGLALVAADPGSRPLELAWRLVVVGVGFGLFLTPVQTLALAAAPADLRGTTAATTNLARQTGIGLGPALATAVWAATGYTAAGLRLGLALAVVPAAAAVLAVLRARPPVASNQSAE
jgi:predicted MFS family arabinose efflux permease